tara:strand:- start:13072 stop:13512 length:441 start_codon:yes stop_codon:yes gene_type:complete
MTNKYDGLNETFDTDFSDQQYVDAKLVKKVNEPKIYDDSENEIKKDYNYTRGNLYSIIEKGQEALNGVLELAQESDQPRAYEVAGQLIKSVSDATDKLLDLQKKIKDLEEDKTPKGPTTVNNALFVGSTAELSKMLKNKSIDENNK